MQYPILKIGVDNKKYVKKLQKLLKIDDDGIFGSMTKASVVAIQSKHGLNPDGIVGEQTWNALLGKEVLLLNTIKTAQGIRIHNNLLDDNEYYKSIHKKRTIVGHHTAGWNDPYGIVAGWEHDKTSSGGVRLVGTPFVIGRYNSIHRKSHDLDGLIVRCFSEKYWAYHLGLSVAKTKKIRLEAQAIPFELANWGPLVERNGKLYTWVGGEFPKDQAVYYPNKFRGYNWYEKYTDRQLASARRLILELSDTHEIPVKGNYDISWFDYKQEVIDDELPGLWNHCNYRKDKSDLHPQEELIDMLNSL